MSAEDFKESNYEEALIQLFQDMGYRYVYAPNVVRDFKSPLYEEVLEQALKNINLGLPDSAISEALYKLKNFENGELAQKNDVFMDYLQNGIEVSFLKNGEEVSDRVYIADYDNVDRNSFIIANQWTFIENSNKRPDMIVFLNGLPIVDIELKSPSREDTDASEGYNQLRNYIVNDIPSMYIY